MERLCVSYFTSFFEISVRVIQARGILGPGGWIYLYSCCVNFLGCRCYISVVISLKNRGVWLCGGVPKCMFFFFIKTRNIAVHANWCGNATAKSSEQLCVLWGGLLHCQMTVDVWIPIYSLIAYHLSTLQGGVSGLISHGLYTRVQHLILIPEKAYVACTS